MTVLQKVRETLISQRRREKPLLFFIKDYFVVRN